MPLTRKSSSAPIEVTDSHISSEENPSFSSRQPNTREKVQEPKTGTGNKESQYVGKLAAGSKPGSSPQRQMEKASRTRRQAASVLETAEAESDKTGNQTKAKVKKKGHGLSEKETQVINKEDKSTTEKMEVGVKIDTSRRTSSKGRKRSPEESSGNIEKKPKLKSDDKEGNKEIVESFSPRRSSRTSVPNSRYRDMLDNIPGRRQKSGMTKEKAKPKRDKGYYAVEIEVSGTDSESEDIVTEEIPIDTSQAMDALASSNTATISIVDNEIEVEVDVEDHDKALETGHDSSKAFGSVKPYVSLVPDVKDAPKHSPVYSPSVLPRGERSKPKVIVFDPMKDKGNIGTVKLAMSDKKKTKHPAPFVKGRLLEIDTSSLKRISNVSAGQVVHVPTIKSTKLDRTGRTKEVEVGERINLIKGDIVENVTVSHNGKDSLLESFRGEETIKDKQVTEREDNQNVKIDFKTDDMNTKNQEVQSAYHTLGSTVSPNRSTDTTSVAANTNEELGFQTSKALLSAQEEEKDSIQAEAKSKEDTETVPITKILVVKDDIQKGDGQENSENSVCKEVEKTQSLEEVSVTVMSNSVQHVSDTGVPESDMHDTIEIIPADTLYTDIDLGEHEEMEVVTVTDKTENSEFIAIPDMSEPYTVEVVDKELFVNKDLESDDSNKHNETSKTALQNSFCEVIEYEGKRKPPQHQQGSLQTGFDYIMFGDNLVEIRKPQTLHGRIQPVKKSETDSKSGQIEFVVIHPPKSSKPSTVIDSEEGKSVSARSDLTHHAGNLSTIAPVKLLGPLQNQSVRPTQFAPHGHIVRSDPNAPPTDVVEITEDIFQKEIYREDAAEEVDKGEALPQIVSSLESSTEDAETTLHVDESRPVSTAEAHVSTSTEKFYTAPVNAAVGLSEINIGDSKVKIISASSLENQDKMAETSNITKPFQKGSSVAGKIIVVGKDYLKDNGEITNALEYQVGTLNFGKHAESTINKGDGANVITIKTSDGPVIEDVTEGEHDECEENATHSDTNADRETNEEHEKADSATEESEHSDSKIVVVHSGKVKPIYSEGQKLVTAGTQTPIATKPIYRGLEEDNVITTTITAGSVNVGEVNYAGTTEKQQTEQYIIVHLPPGTEVTKAEIKKPVNYKQYQESEITMLENGQFICVDCNYVTDKRSNWFKHRRKHLGIKPHQCPMCAYKAATSSNLKRHIGIHQDIRNFVCPLCGMAFRQKIHLERHLKYRHEEKKVKCPLCEYTCANENPDLKIHIKRRHMPLPDGSVLPFTCDMCGIMTVSKKDLRQHKKFHKNGPELKLFCEFCSFVTDCDSRLKRHMYIHTKEKPFQCGLCAYRATQKEHVLRHMKSQHDIEVIKKKKVSLLPQKEKENDTESGDSDAEEKSPFEQADYSSKDRIFACNHCTMRFAKLINLYKHLYSQHKSLMPDPSANDFQCVVCEFRTNNKKNLLVHMRKHNMQDQTPPSHVYSCVLCRYINPRRKNLFQHMKKKHGIEIMVKEDGTTNCYLSADNAPVVLGREEGDTNVMSLADIVTTHTLDDDNAIQIEDSTGNSIQIITEDKINPSGNISIENVISIDDMTSYVVNSSAQDIVLENNSVDTAASTQAQTHTVFTSSVTEHEAAEAIEGLQALAQQAGLLESQTTETVDTSDIVTTEIMDTGEISLSQQEVMSQQEVLSEPAKDGEEEVEDGIQLSPEQINQLSSGDYVEINGEVYKVEIASDNPVLTK